MFSYILRVHFFQEKVLNAEETVLQKALPRLPSVDDAYEVYDTPCASAAPSTSEVSTPVAYPLPPLPPSTPQSPVKDATNQDASYFTTKSTTSIGTHMSRAPTLPSKDNSEELLVTLRLNFQKIEQSLYTQLARTSEGHLNDVRRSFIATGKGTQKRLIAWQKKHLGHSKSKIVGDLVAEEPEWWAKGCHALPGGNIIVREDDMGSIIAHTLRYARKDVPYFRDLTRIQHHRLSIGTRQSIHSSFCEQWTTRHPDSCFRLRHFIVFLSSNRL